MSARYEYEPNLSSEGQDNYYGVDGDHLTIAAVPKALELDERIYNSMPTAVMCFERATVIVEQPETTRRAVTIRSA